MVDTVVEVFPRVSGWLQVVIQIGLLVLAYRLRYLFTGHSSWTLIWVAFGVAFVIMLMDRILNAFMATVGDHPPILYAQSFILPLIVGASIYAGLTLLYHLLSRFPSQSPKRELPNPAGINITEQSIVTAWDVYAEEMFGWSVSEAINQPLTALIIPDRLQQAHRNGVDRYLREREQRNLSVKYEVMAHHKNGREFQVVVRISVVPQPDGTLQFAGTINRLGY